MKGDVWYLKNTTDNNRIVAKFEFTDDFFTGNCWKATSWAIDNAQEVYDWDYIADAYLKWDSCTHWRFYGEDWNSGDKEVDPYYHLCGSRCFFEHIRCMCFIWQLAIMIFGEPTSKTSNLTDDYYKDHEGLNKLIDIALKDCVIEKEENH